jgi:hypothetical protein
MGMRMGMKSLLTSAIALAALTTVAMAAEPMSSQQMDRVTAGGFSFGSTAVAIASAAAVGGRVFTSTSTFALAGHNVSISLSSSVSSASTGFSFK